MPAFGFQKQFVMPILTGVKTSTIRKERKDGRQPAKRGDMIKLFYGMRTKQCEMISEVICVLSDPIMLRTSQIGRLIIKQGSCHLSVDEIDKLALAEGFPNRHSMYQWFSENHRINSDPFYGWNIQWSSE